MSARHMIGCFALPTTVPSLPNLRVAINICCICEILRKDFRRTHGVTELRRRGSRFGAGNCLEKDAGNAWPPLDF